MAELNEKAARIARGEADRAGRPVLVAGSIGPTGELIEPLGALSLEAAREAFAEQAAALARGGADLLWIETMSSVEETEAAVAGARTTDLPVVATLSFDTNGRTMMGITPVGSRRTASQASSRGLRQQLRRESLGARRLDRQSGGRIGLFRHCWSRRPIAVFRNTSTARSASTGRRN